MYPTMEMGDKNKNDDMFFAQEKKARFFSSSSLLTTTYKHCKDILHTYIHTHTKIYLIYFNYSKGIVKFL